MQTSPSKRKDVRTGIQHKDASAHICINCELNCRPQQKHQVWLTDIENIHSV